MNIGQLRLIFRTWSNVFRQSGNAAVATSPYESRQAHSPFVMFPTHAQSFLPQNRHRRAGTRNRDLCYTATPHIVISLGACAACFATHVTLCRRKVVRLLFCHMYSRWWISSESYFYRVTRLVS